MKRVLFLAYYFPPIAASGSLRPAGFSAHLREHGYEPLIVSTDSDAVHPPVRLDPSLLGLVDDGIQVERLQYINWLKVLLDVRERFRSTVGSGAVTENEQKESAGGGRKSFSVLGVVSRTKTAILNRVFLFPDHQKPWMLAAGRFANSLKSDQRPDVVLASGNPWSALVAGNRIARELGVPFVADFRDPWTGNPKAAVSEAIHKLSLKEERRVLQGATKVIANTEELRGWFDVTYPDLRGRFVSITNGYNESFRTAMQQVEAAVRPVAKVELCHLGSIYELRKPVALFRALGELSEQQRIGPGDILLRFTGAWIVEDAECNELAAQLEQKGLLVREEAVSHGEYLRRLKESPYLLILQQSFPLQIPGKIYEYIASGRPLVVIGGEGATANLVAQHGLGAACENEVAALKDLLLSLVDGTAQVAGAPDAEIEQFGYHNLTRQLASVLDEAVDVYQQRK